MKNLILVVKGVLVMHGQLIEDAVLNSNFLIANLMLLTILSIMVTVFFQVEVVNLPLLKDATAWRKFRELLPLLTWKAIALNTRGQIYNSCVRGTMLYSSECMALRQEDRKYLKRSEEFISKNSLLSQLKLKRLDSVLICNRLCWFGLVKQS